MYFSYFPTLVKNFTFIGNLWLVMVTNICQQKNFILVPSGGQSVFLGLVITTQTQLCTKYRIQIIPLPAQYVPYVKCFVLMFCTIEAQRRLIRVRQSSVESRLHCVHFCHSVPSAKGSAVNHDIVICPTASKFQPSYVTWRFGQWFECNPAAPLPLSMCERCSEGKVA